MNKFDPFLKKGVSGELIYFAKYLLSFKILPPTAIGSPDIFLIGNNTLSLNLDIYFFLFSSKVKKPVFLYRFHYIP